MFPVALLDSRFVLKVLTDKQRIAGDVLERRPRTGANGVTSQRRKLSPRRSTNRTVCRSSGLVHIAALKWYHPSVHPQTPGRRTFIHHYSAELIQRRSELSLVLLRESTTQHGTSEHVNNEIFRSPCYGRRLHGRLVKSFLIVARLARHNSSLIHVLKTL